MNLKLFFQSPQEWALLSYKIGRKMRCRILRGIYVYFIWTPIRVITGIEIYPETKIGKNLVIKHFGGIFIHPKAQIGDNCVIFNNVTIGTGFDEKEFPVIGNNVQIGVGAKIIGGVYIGDNVNIGANAVVTKNRR